MEIIRTPISRQDLIDRFTTSYPTVVKAVVDLGRGIIALDAEWHADLEVLLLEEGSKQENLWGINLMPLKRPEDFIIFESLINIRPAQKNFSLDITDANLQARIQEVVSRLILYDSGTGLREPVWPYEPEICAGAGFGSPTRYPCFKHHKQLTIEKWLSFNAYKRVLMIANEFGRAKTLIQGNHHADVLDCYERALELFHITVEAASLENGSPEIVARLLRLRERTTKLYAERKLDKEENQSIRDELIALDPQAFRALHPDPEKKYRTDDADETDKHGFKNC
jgi:hypothetical protein